LFERQATLMNPAWQNQTAALRMDNCWYRKIQWIDGRSPFSPFAIAPMKGGSQNPAGGLQGDSDCSELYGKERK
jgi:hypothetical protein